MQDSPFLSVILPTYNRKACITRMIDSILKQSFTDFELIIIDDGSTDNTLEMLNQAYNDKRISIIRKHNGGVSSARNLGITLAQGKYLTFVDSDDYLLDKFFEDIFEKISQYLCDILVYGGYILRKNTQHEIPLFWFDQKYGESEVIVSCGQDFVKDFCLLGGNSMACAKIFNKDLIKNNHISCNENIAYGEDMLFDLQAYLVACKIVTSPKKFYVYDNNTESLSRGMLTSVQKVRNLLKGYRCLGQYKEYQSYFAYNYLRHMRKFYFCYFFLDAPSKDQIELMYNQTSCKSTNIFEKLEFFLAGRNLLYALPLCACLYLVYGLYARLLFLHPIVAFIKRRMKKKAK